MSHASTAVVYVTPSLGGGHQAMSVDFLDTEVPGPHYKGDIRDVTDSVRQNHGGGWDLLVAHPPCTRLTNSGVRWLVEPPTKLQPWQYPEHEVAAYAAMSRDERLAFMWQKLDEAVAFYQLLRDLPIARKAIENPIMHCHARERVQIGHRQVVQPWQFGEPAFKATGLELINLPDLVPTDVLQRPAKGTDEYKKWSAVHLASPGPNRWKDRSRTFQGIADAMAAQWGALGAMPKKGQMSLLEAA